MIVQDPCQPDGHGSIRLKTLATVLRPVQGFVTSSRRSTLDISIFDVTTMDRQEPSDITALPHTVVDNHVLDVCCQPALAVETPLSVLALSEPGPEPEPDTGQMFMSRRMLISTWLCPHMLDC
jgi:hypothetical protein